MEKTVEYYMNAAQRAAEDIGALGYDEYGLNEVAFFPDTGSIFARFRVVDDFQRKLRYDQQVQHYSINIAFNEEKGCFPVRDLLNREQRELHVLLKQQADSTVLRDDLTSAAGRRFVEALCAERAKYAQLCDFTPRDDVPF